MAIRGVFHALPPQVFGARIRTAEDIARFIAGEHPIQAPRQLDVTDAWACLGKLCAHFAMPRVMGIQPVRVSGPLATLLIPAYRLAPINACFDRVTPGQLAEAIAQLATEPPPDGRDWARDTRGLALLFLRLKQFYRDCAADGCDILFVKDKGAPGCPHD
ncbi:hypothetical protein G3580_12020 [Nitrogeniibacter mangrovi]|uniref:Uncharacterized protein n=1 Tax=Nitrogeniibacter mangrovi TaxID=2016596 RepID=A0A6C1B424_9RHOO|nr:hypothetical protein [Nitrogeniibacter mangrovi]QID18297.1 hypothetical protein G3580_12020 [Nitrogeniibacter mangrovi]